MSKGLNSDDDGINQIETELKTYETDEWKKAKIRSRNTIKDESEKASKYFLNLEKQQINNGKIDKLLTNDGNYADQPDTMLNCANICYSNLYKEEEISDFHLQHIISKIKTKLIPDDIHSNLDCEITVNEVRTAIFQMNKNKSPGQDGLTVEFYQTFWDFISLDLIDVYNDCLKKVLCVSL